ncbi:DUF5960 family protein [uncultured Enterococcus sp.]|uniref:DUF5960 family protein n=1 Tax=uncultured Enterococcus sp. TaxID=167972 RepID=UPI002AA7CA77|nr:DUF5960 family protein [uncultured Enterococcus sp.]
MNVNGKDISMFYDMKNTEKFINDFYSQVNTDVPYEVLKSDILSLMCIRNLNYFKIPAKKTQTGKDVFFRYEILEKNFTKSKTTYLYKYLSYDYNGGNDHE